ncbi:MAG TPA: YceI family protein [Gemmatimonadaceae bacterium]|nr:YceI family protein [Gemmatimonadaceae bacterium]
MRPIRLVILSLVAPAIIQAQTALTTKPPRIQEYRLDAGHSIIEFSIGFAFSRIKGRFTNSNGNIVYDTVDPSKSSITVVIESKSIDTGWPHRDEHLRTSDFFDVEKYPTIVFQSERLTQTANGWRADGKLTMKGVTKQISIPFHLLRPPTRSPESNWMIINAEGALKIARADFGILGGSTYNSWFDKARQATMSDSVDVSLEIEGWNADSQSQRTARLEQSLERIRTTGIQSQIDRLAEIMRTQPTQAAGVLNGGDFVTRALLASGRTDDALKLSKALTEMVPSQPRAFVLYGVALALSGDNKGALRQYAKAKEVFKPAVKDPNEKFPQVDETWYYLDQLTEFLLEWNRPTVALPVARLLTELYPDFARAHTTLGVVLAATGDRKAAATAYAQALTLDPNETRALEFRRR